MEPSEKTQAELEEDVRRTQADLRAAKSQFFAATAPLLGTCGCLALVGIALFLWIISGKAPDTPGVAAQADNPSNATISVMAHQFIKRKLKAPSTADFSHSDEESITDLGGHRYTVVGWVDSQNSFGAKLRAGFVCKLHYQGHDEWESSDAGVIEQQ